MNSHLEIKMVDGQGQLEYSFINFTLSSFLYFT